MALFIKRLLYSDKSTKINFLIYPFLLATLSYGMGFVFFGWTEFISQSSLYSAMTLVHPFFPFFWGIGALVAILLVFLFILTRRNFKVTDSAALLGTMCWLFAGISYALTGGYFLIFAVALPNIMFWIWYFFRLAYFRRYGVPDVDLDRVIR